MEVREFDWDSSRKGASQLSRTKTIRLSIPKTTTGEILIFALKGKCIDFSSRAQMKDNWISVPMVYLSLAYGKGNLPYRRFPDPVSMATTGDDAHSA